MGRLEYRNTSQRKIIYLGSWNYSSRSEKLSRMNQTIGQIYKCKPIQDAQYSLQIWYNNLLKKTEYELTTFDVIRMIRQRKFVDLAVKKALELLINNPFVGDCFPGELLEKLMDIDSTIVKQNRTIINRIILMCQEKIDNYDWSDYEEKEDYMNRLYITIDKFNLIINEVNDENKK